MTRLIEELRSKYPRLAARAEASPTAAIKLFCLECMGGDFAAVFVCEAPECPLYRFRPLRRMQTGEARQLTPEARLEGARRLSAYRPRTKLTGVNDAPETIPEGSSTRGQL